MLKRFFVCIFAFILTVIGTSSAFAASTEDSVLPQGDSARDAAYTIVSAKVNREYDFKDDFHDSYLYDDDFYTEGIFRLDDYNGDVTLTLKNNTTGEVFTYERNPKTEWSVKAALDHLLYETAEIDAAVHIYDLGGEYGIKEVDIPVKITVISSLYSADFHKYPSYEGSYTAMYEGEDFSVSYDASSGGKATITLLKEPWLFSLGLYNVETGQIEYYETDDAEFEFPTEVEVDDYDPSCSSFWFSFPSKLIMDDGYVFEFTMSVNAFRKNSSTADTAAPDNGEISAPSKAAADTTDSDIGNTSTLDSAAVKQSFGAVKTGERAGAIALSASVLIASAFIALYIKKRKGDL